MPDTIPVPAPIGATVTSLLVHEPPGVPSLSVVLLPWHTVGVPITDNKGWTVT